MNSYRSPFLILIIVLSVTLCYGFLYEPNAIEVKHIRVKASSLGKVLGGKTVVHLSDLHLNQIGSRGQRVLEILDEIRPDVVFLTGDYVQWGGEYGAALEFLAKVKAKNGVWAVMGDYDYSSSRKSCQFCHERGTGQPTRAHEVKFLRNNMAKVDLEGGVFWIAGLDAENEEDLAPELLNAVKGVEVPVIILSHNPLNFDLFESDQDMFMISGDTHGGQVWLPSWPWKLIGYEKCARYGYGLFEEGRKKLFVSKGIGTSHLPFRFLRRPEVVVLHFE